MADPIAPNPGTPNAGTPNPTSPHPAAHGAPQPRPSAGPNSSLPFDPQAAPQLDPANEKPLWSGRSSWKSLYPPLIIWALASGLLLGLGAYFALGTTVLYVTAAVLGAILLVLLSRHLWHIISTRYRLTNQRLFIERGIFVQTVDQTELIRVDDVTTRQNLIQRMFGLGEVLIVANDRTDGRLVLHDIDNPAEVAEHVRRHTRSVQRRTVFMESL